MKPVLIAVFFINLSTSIQEESQGRLHPAYIYNGGVTKVKESESITFKCSTFNITVNITEIHMYLFKNSERFMMKDIEKKDDTTFPLTNLTVEHSGLYTCLYSEKKLNVSKTNATGHNSVSLDVWGKILPARIESTETSVTKGETMKLTCTFTKIQNCAQVYVYLCVNGIGNSKKQVNCSNRNISTTFHLIVSENSVNYSCVYSVSNYNVSEVRYTGENTIFVQVPEKGFGFWTLIIGVSVAVSVVLLVLLGLCYCRNILFFRMCQDPDVRKNPNNEHFYHEIATDTPVDTFYTVENGELHFREGPVEDLADNVNNLYSKVQMVEETLCIVENGVLHFSEGPVEDLADNVNNAYSTVQMFEVPSQDEQPAEKFVDSNIDAVCYDTVKSPYAAIQKRKGNAGGDGHNVLVPCKISSVMAD
ncbi:uncharacterized protein LOC113650820 isoform X2 [Tachysurus fulvidraco]|uniref:uncharacterized protein LOC113650820 isoform X2 n=1 Tax=Tachysurus fulvidraco TaxID=1234273 RepID=UPI001FEDAA74|nr:uncharacterized protein LOC113650820 isoform X2 [Tachysurus fulvidraco]XP_027015179.2 uncharacterized protein LOC113650820 isoform X2 [Tachysurus fulvidraco]